MPIYDVLVTREASEHTVVRVVASSIKQAESKALKRVGTYGEKADKWTVDDGNDHEPYICDPGNCATEVTEEPQLPGEPVRPPLPPVPPGHRTNLDTIHKAAQVGDLALMQFYAKGETDAVTVLCAMQRNPDDTISPIPLARMFAGNPYELLEPPFTDDNEELTDEQMISALENAYRGSTVLKSDLGGFYLSFEDLADGHPTVDYPTIKELYESEYPKREDGES